MSEVRVREDEDTGNRTINSFSGEKREIVIRELPRTHISV
jgi:hypothetical protein